KAGQSFRQVGVNNLTRRGIMSQSPQGGAVLPTLPWNSLMILCSSRAKTGHIPQKGIPGIPEVYKNAPFDAITF
ncbi:MAG: hypothetical protein COX16_14985, partial [Deltaproteobacteria bacterium CG23_combo_of_CG06-09_8_20_14_all_51_20]